MSKTIKIFISFLLIYEPFVYWMLSDNGYDGVCRYLFTSGFCNTNFRYFLFLFVPLILMTIYLIWEKQLKSIFNHRKEKRIEVKNKRNQYIGPVKAIALMFSRSLQFKGISTRAEFWWAYLFAVIMQAIVCFVQLKDPQPILFLCFFVAFYFPTISLRIRRWNDIGFPGFWMEIPNLLLSILSVFILIGHLPMWATIAIYLILSIPFIRIILLGYGLFSIIMFCLPSKLKQ